MKTYGILELKQEFNRLGYVWLPFMFIGIRSKADEPNKFDDVFILVENDNLFQFKNTTNPGTTYLQKLLNPKGSAILKPGQYVDTWSIGLHRGKYEALVQVRPLTVWRDGDRDLKSEKGIEDTGLFGINIHKANNGLTEFINGHSAGCQVFQNSADFDFVMRKAKSSGKRKYTYTLLDEF